MDYATKYLGKVVKIHVDRPLGSKHPKYGFIYRVNYGFIPDTRAPDGEEIDAYILGIFEPIYEFEGMCIAIIHRTNDEDDKLVLVPKGIDYTDEQIESWTEFQEKFFESEIIR